MQTKLTTTILGHVGSDSEIKINNGKTYLQFSICHNESYKNKDGAKVEKSQWVTCFRPMKDGSTLKLEKGAVVLATGDTSLSCYKDNDGGYKAGLTLNNCDFSIIGHIAKKEETNLEG